MCLCTSDCSVYMYMFIKPSDTLLLNAPSCQCLSIYYNEYRLLDSLVIECWHRVREVPGLSPVKDRVIPKTL